MEVTAIFLFLLTVPCSWSMPAEWSQWSPVDSNLQDSPGDSSSDGGDFLDFPTDGFPEFPNGGGPQFPADGGPQFPGDGGPQFPGVGGAQDGASLADIADDVADALAPVGGLGLLGGGAALATLVGIAASTGLIKAGTIKAGLAKTGLFSAGTLGLDHYLLPKGRLDKGEELTSHNGMFKLEMREDGNLIISHQDGVVVWSTNTAGSGSYFIFQKDGDMVVYNGGSPNNAVWSSGTGGQGGKKLKLKNDGFLVLLGSGGQKIWKSRPHTLLVNQKLHSGYSMASSNGKFKLSMQGDGDLVLYSISGDQGVVTWSTGPAQKWKLGYLLLQNDGNLVTQSLLVNQWQSMTKGSGAQSLVLQDDGTLELCCKKDGSAIWTNTMDNGAKSKDQVIKSVKAGMKSIKSIKAAGMKSIKSIKAAGIKSIKAEGIKSIKANLGSDMKAEDLKSFELTSQEIISELSNVPGSLKGQGSSMKTDGIKSRSDEMTSQEIMSELTEAKSEPLREGRQHVWKGWSAWSEFTTCTATCGPATKMRERTCTDLINEGTMCQGPTAEIFNCNLPSCSIEGGGWSSWSDVTECSATCGPAVRTRRRTCTPQSNGGLDCLGSSEEVIDCDLTDCPEIDDSSSIAGGWSGWSDFTDCTASCGSGTRMRVRECSDIGRMCQGSAEEIEDCNLGACGVTEWGDWSEYSACSATCGYATRRRERTCTSPESSDGTIPCQGPTEYVQCELADCPIDGGWSAWSEFSECSSSCGPATKRRQRTCSEPEPADGGLICQGANQDIVDCNLKDC